MDRKQAKSIINQQSMLFVGACLGIGGVMLLGNFWLNTATFQQRPPTKTIRKPAPRHTRVVRHAVPPTLNALLQQATHAVNARDEDTLKSLVTPDARASFGWIQERTTKNWAGDVLVLPIDTPYATEKAPGASASTASPLLYLAVFHAWHTCESDGDHVHRLELTTNGEWRLGAEISETETGGYRVRDHDLNVSINPAQHAASIKDTVRVETTGTPLLPVCLLRLSEDFQVSAITHRASPVPFAQAGGILAVAPPAAGADRSFALSLTYGGRVFHQGSDYITPQEATLNSYWYPHIARLPATSTVTTTAPHGWTPILQGEKRQEKRNADGSLTVTYRNEVPNCFFTLDMGPYAVTTHRVNGRTLSACLLAPNAKLAQRSLDLLAKSLAFYETEFAPFPYTHYEVVETRGPFNGALEAYSFATFGAGTLPSELPHELSHTWWGGLVPCPYTRSMWNESFAQYSSDLFARRNPQAAEEVDVETPAPGSKRRAFGNAFNGATVKAAHDTSDNIQNAVGYGKGALVLRVLEAEIGWEKMRASIRAFLAAHPRGEAADWPEFARAVNTTTGQDYGWFFAQWLQRTGLPHLRFANVVSQREADGTYRVEGDIVQQGELYRLRLPLNLQTGEGKPQRKIIEVAGAQTHFEVSAPTPPTRLTLDPDNILPLATTAEQANVDFK